MNQIKINIFIMIIFSFVFLFGCERYTDDRKDDIEKKKKTEDMFKSVLEKRGDNMIGKTTLLNKMLNGINAIKLILYKVKVDDLSTRFEDIEFAKNIAGTVVNEIFCEHNEVSKKRFDKNKELVIKEIENLGKNHQDLKQPITDALRINGTIYFNSSSEKNEGIDYAEQCFKNAQERGIFIKGGDAPVPEKFFEDIQKLGLKYKVFDVFNWVPAEYKWKYNPLEPPSQENDASAYCPKCRSQYREGFDICSDCGIELIKFDK